MFIAKLEFRPLPNIKENNSGNGLENIMYSLRWAYPNDLGRVSYLDSKSTQNHDEQHGNQHEWSLISRRIFMDHFLDEPLDACRMIHLDDLSKLKQLKVNKEESNHMDEFIEQHTKEASEENDLFHNEQVAFIVKKSMTMALGKLQRGFDISQWYETLKESFGSDQEVNRQLIAPIYIVRDEDEFLELRTVQHCESVFVRCDGCSPKDVSSDCLYETTSEGWSQLMDHVQRSTRCNLFFERMKDLDLDEVIYIARPKTNIFKEMRCIIIDQILHYVIDEGNEGWSFVTGKSYMKWQEHMMEPIRKVCSLICKSVPWDNFTLDLGLVNNESSNDLEWKVIELNTILKGITGLGEAEDNIDLVRYDHSFAKSEPIVYADQL